MSPSGEFLLYITDDGQAKLEVRLVDETVWLSQSQLAELFQTTKQNISQHIKKIFDEGELQIESVVKDFFTTASDGKSYRVVHFNPRWGSPYEGGSGRSQELLGCCRNRYAQSYRKHVPGVCRAPGFGSQTHVHG